MNLQITITKFLNVQLLNLYRELTSFGVQKSERIRV